jgi:hypothetical protein
VAVTLARVIVAVVLLPVANYAVMIFLRGMNQSAREFVVVIEIARDKSITVVVIVGLAFLAFVVRAAHKGI